MTQYFTEQGHMDPTPSKLYGIYLPQTDRPVQTVIDWLSWGLTTRQPLWVILCRLPEKGRKETEEIAEEMKERDREERGTGMKVKKQKK